MTYPEYREGKQPCDNFTPNEDEEWFGSVRHECPDCGHLRMFCLSCSNDHHEGGWLDCWTGRRSQSDHIADVNKKVDAATDAGVDDG